MIIGLGTDIIEIERVSKCLKNPRFAQKVFSQGELEALLDGGRAEYSAQSAAGKFAAKEAVAKALGTGFVGFSPSDIEILEEGNGKPFARLKGNALSALRKIGAVSLHVSISHAREYASAVAVIEG